ncbi:MAG: hypothetical protein HC779_02890 [Phyllobacteriaceae bacterium]|nr:hypothetical protein [Phyllobacteriaceae bacterium]
MTLYAGQAMEAMMSLYSAPDELPKAENANQAGWNRTLADNLKALGIPDALQAGWTQNSTTPPVMSAEAVAALAFMPLTMATRMMGAWADMFSSLADAEVPNAARPTAHVPDKQPPSCKRV